MHTHTPTHTHTHTHPHTPTHTHTDTTSLPLPSSPHTPHSTHPHMHRDTDAKHTQVCTHLHINNFVYACMFVLMEVGRRQRQHMGIVAITKVSHKFDRLLHIDLLSINTVYAYPSSNFYVTNLHKRVKSLWNHACHFSPTRQVKSPCLGLSYFVLKHDRTHHDKVRAIIGNRMDFPHISVTV